MPCYGLLAEFRSPEELIAAAKKLRALGFIRLDAYSPLPIDGLAEIVGSYKDRVPLLTLIGGLVGGAGGYFLQWYTATRHYPINVGGRPLHSWPSFIPITFEMTVLGAAIFAVIGMLALSRLPQLYHPLFNVPEFELASRNRFFLCVHAEDSMFELPKTQRLLESLQPIAVREVPQ